MVARPSQEYGSPALPLLWRLTGRESTLGGRRSYRPTMDTFTELRQLADVLTELGDNATAALVRQAIDRFIAWKFGAGERLLERALEERRQREHEPRRSPFFNTCVLAIA